MSTTDSGQPDQDSKKVIVIIVISILLGVNGLLLWQFFDKKMIIIDSAIHFSPEKNKIKTEFRLGKVDYSIHDALMSGFACMHFQDPSLLQFQKRLEKKHHKSNQSNGSGREFIQKKQHLTIPIHGKPSYINRCAAL